MTQSSDTSAEDIQEKKIRIFIEVQLGKNADSLSLQQKKEKLRGKFKKVMIMMGLNVVFLGFFTISFVYDITRLSGFWYNLIILFFVVNTLLYIYQWRQLRQAVDWVDAKLSEQ